MDLTKDRMITTGITFNIGMGVDPKRVMAELLGKVTGTSKGMGGSMHIFSKAPLLWWSRNVGGQIPVGAGLAFADKYFETNAVLTLVMVQLAKALYRSL
jgi:pyruvate dehydrogenase E1 component alpha subunit